MIPYADFINHENVNIEYDYLDKETGQSIKSEDEETKQLKKEEKLLAMLKKRLFLEDLK